MHLWLWFSGGFQYCLDNINNNLKDVSIYVMCQWAKDLDWDTNVAKNNRIHFIRISDSVYFMEIRSNHNVDDHLFEEKSFQFCPVATN